MDKDYIIIGPYSFNRDGSDLGWMKRALDSERRAGKFDKHFGVFGIGAGSIIGTIATAVGGVFSNGATNSARKSEYMETVRPELEAETEELKATLSERYPQFDTSGLDSTNIVAGVRKAYNDCYYTNYGGAFAEDQTFIKDGWLDFYVDYKRGNLNFVADRLDSIANGYDHYPILDSVKDMIPVGVAAMAITCAIFAAPYIHSRINAYRISKAIDSVEASCDAKKL